MLRQMANWLWIHVFLSQKYNITTMIFGVASITPLISAVLPVIAWRLWRWTTNRCPWRSRLKSRWTTTVQLAWETTRCTVSTRLFVKSKSRRPTLSVTTSRSIRIFKSHNQRTSPARDSFGQRQINNKTGGISIARYRRFSFSLVLNLLWRGQDYQPPSCYLAHPSWQHCQPRRRRYRQSSHQVGQSPNHPTKHHPQS